MYFCPCASNDPIEPETEENELFSLPRNLSYVQDSYLDRYSVSARFVHNPKIERCIQHEQGQEWRANAEDETLGLLSAITSQDIHGRCDGEFESVNSSGFIFPNHDILTKSELSKQLSPTSSTWSTVQSSSFSVTSLLQPASIVASKISSFLHSPPNESMDSARDIGTSVDGDNITLPLQSEVVSRLESSILIGSKSSGEEMDSHDHLTLDGANYSRDGVVNEFDDSPVGEDIRTATRFGDEDANSLELISDNGVLDTCDVFKNSDNFQWNNSTNSESCDHIRTTESRYSCPPCEFSDSHDKTQSHIGEKTIFPQMYSKNDKEDAEIILNCNDLDLSNMSSKYPTLMSLNVDDNRYLPYGDVVPDEEGEYSCGVVGVTIPKTLYGSPDSDAFIEEGVFLNIDDLDSSANEKSTTVSDASDDTCISADSMFLSPDEGELVEEDADEPVRKMTLEEAINRAASDLTKMSLEMYGLGLPSVNSNTSSSCSLLDTEEDLKLSALTIKTEGRISPTVLKVKITDHNDIETQNFLTDSSTTLYESPIYSEHEFNFSRVELRKSSSLKSNKTPPGTPHRKKVVRFADAMGLDLESVRHVLNMESPPKIPQSALADLMDGLHEENKEVGTRYLCPCFSQPGAVGTFYQKVRNLKVSLENAIVNDLTITGLVRVANIAYNKSVRIRYTHTGWSTFYDIAASYVLNSCDGPTDRFSFSIVAPPYFGPNSRLEFAVCFIAEGTEFWDNNDGQNYVFECFAKTIPTDSETAWLHFL